MSDTRAVPKEITADNERRAWELRTQCWTMQRIADFLGINVSTVCRMLQRKEKALAAEFKEQAEEVKLRQTAMLEEMAQELFGQWLRSCEDAEKITTEEGRYRFDKATGEAVPLPDRITRAVEGQSGNPALLGQAMKALADIRAIWGLDAPKRQEIAGEVTKVLILPPETEAKV